MMLSAAALLIGVCALTGDDSGPTGLRGWIGFAAVPFLYGIAIVSIMAALSTIGVVKTSVYMNFEPVATIFFSALVLDQYLSPIQ